MNEENNIFIHLKTVYGQQHTVGWPFYVPHNYFSSFDQKLADRIYDEDHSPDLLLNIANKTPYSVPSDYFAKEESHISALSQVTLRPAYRVSTGYFADFNQRIFGKLYEKPSIRKISKSWWQIAAAAVFIGMVVLTSFFFFGDTNSEQRNRDAANLAQQKIESVETDQLAGFLGIPDTSFNSQTAIYSQKPIDLDQLLKKISDKDLKKFLDETGGDEDDFLIN